MASIIDVHFSLEREVRGYVQGEYGSRCLIDGPLLSMRSSGRTSERQNEMYARVMKVIIDYVRNESDIYDIVPPAMERAHVVGKDAWEHIVARDKARDTRVVHGDCIDEGSNMHIAMLQDVHCTVDGKSIPIGRVSGQQVECNKKFTIEMDGKGRAVEQLLFPALFPAGTGLYVRSPSGVGSRFSLRDYWKFRFNMPF
jgi:hypothetical protein